MAMTWDNRQAKSKGSMQCGSKSLQLCMFILQRLDFALNGSYFLYDNITWRPRSGRTNDSSLPLGHATQELRGLRCCFFSSSCKAYQERKGRTIEISLDLQDKDTEDHWRQATELDLNCLNQLMLEHSWSLSTHTHLSWTMFAFQAHYSRYPNLLRAAALRQLPPAKKAFTIIMDSLSLYIPVSFRADSYSVTAPEQGRPRSTHLHALLLSGCLSKRGKPARFGLLFGVKPGPKTNICLLQIFCLCLCSFACSFCSGWILPSMEATFSTIISHEDQGAAGQMPRVCLLAMQLKSWEGFGIDSSPLAAKLIKKERDAPLK